MLLSRSTPIMGVLALLLALAVVPGMISWPGPIFTTTPSRPAAPALATIDEALASDGGSIDSVTLEVMPADPPPDVLSDKSVLRLRPQFGTRSLTNSLSIERP